MEIRTYTRATEPHRETLAAALVPVVGPHFQRYDKGALFLEANFSGTTDAAVQALITAAPEASAALDTKARVDTLTPIEKAIALVHLDLFNVERARHGAPAVTELQYRSLVKQKVDTLTP